MSVFDGIVQGILGGHSNAGPLQGVLGSILGGGQAPQPGMLGGLLGGGQQQMQQPQGGMGGLMGLVEQFRGAGLGHVADSWVGSGPNQPVSPQQLLQVFGQDRVHQWSQQTGMPQSGLLGALAQFLPQAVDRATPNGRLEQVSDPFGGGGSSAASGGDPFEGAGMSSGPSFTNPGGSYKKIDT